MGLVLFAIVGTVALTLAQLGDPPVVGKPAPPLSLVDLEGRPVEAARWRGRRLVVHFHPQDDTPECLEVLRAFQGLLPKIEQAGLAFAAVGVSDPGKALAYRSQQALTLPMFCDPGGRSARAYGTLVNLLFMRFARKCTVVIDGRGVVERAWTRSLGPEQVQAVKDYLRVAA